MPRLLRLTSIHKGLIVEIAYEYLFNSLAGKPQADRAHRYR